MQLIEPYKQRPIRCIDRWNLRGWHLKVYGITYGTLEPDIALLGAARDIAGRVFPTPAVTDDRYGCGFVGIHQGRDANFLFFCWWLNENELVHRVFRSAGKEDEFSEQSADEVRACTWDIAVIAHEREAWVHHVLNNPVGPDLDGYVSKTLDAAV